MKGTIRQRLTVSVVAITAVMLVLLVLGFNLALRSSLDSDANRLLEARAQAALESVDVENGQLDVNEGSDDGAPDALVWVYQADRAIETPQAGKSLDEVAAFAARSEGGKVDDEATDTRLYSVPVLDGGVQVGTIVTGLSLEPYERTADRSLVASIVLGLVMLVLITITTRIVVARALTPVARMTEEAADWSEHDLDQRFNVGGSEDELSRLAATFDLMLDRMAFMLRHERNFSAELSHELRTPLSAISAEAELALARERSSPEYRVSLERISTSSRELTQILETLLDVSRSEGGSASAEKSEAVAVVETLLDANAALSEQYGIRVTNLSPNSECWVQAGQETLRRILNPVVENALTFASSEVLITVEANGRVVDVIIADDGPGFQADEITSAFEPGHRGSARRQPGAPAGTGLGLPLARRLARANGGEVSVVSKPGEGARIKVTLPGELDRKPD